uniref:Uncharacterized protein n=1 Tax=Meloidogyne enterolobii TaxID=390850 RepID=A0A6V7WUB6_MELEN|nr:unnamed protein product [Meloidogyne enterolobii]
MVVILIMGNHPNFLNFLLEKMKKASSLQFSIWQHMQKSVQVQLVVKTAQIIIVN